MATATVPKPGTASRVGTIDPMDPKKRVYVTDAFEEVEPGSTDAAWVFKRSDLEARRARRAELGLDKNDEAARAQRESRPTIRVAAERKRAALQAEIEALDEIIAADTKATKTESKTSKAEG